MKSLIKYTSHPGKLWDNENAQVYPKTAALHQCMVGCGIYRLFSKTDVEELLYRMPIIFKRLTIFEHYFLADTLFEFDYEGMNYVFTVADLIVHVGMDTDNTPTSFIERNRWESKLETYWVASGIMGAAKDLNLNTDFTVQEGVLDLSLKVGQPVPYDNKASKDASILVNSIMKEIADEVFELVGNKTKERHEELEQKRLWLEKGPEHVFNYVDISREVKIEFFKHIWHSDYEANISEVILENEEVLKEKHNEVYLLMRLTWLWANDYVVINGPFTDVDVRQKFSLADYDGMNEDHSGINLESTFEYYDLEAVVDLFKIF